MSELKDNPWTGQEALDIYVQHPANAVTKTHTEESWRDRASMLIGDVSMRIKSGISDDVKIVAIERIASGVWVTEINGANGDDGEASTTTIVDQPFDSVEDAKSAYSVLATNTGGVGIFNDGIAFTYDDGADTYSYLNFVTRSGESND